MAKRSGRSFPTEGTVIIEHAGRRVSGSYSARAGRITVTTLFGSKTTVLSGTRGLAAKALAGLLLRELAKEGRA
jgi:hypothetical protein